MCAERKSEKAAVGSAALRKMFSGCSDFVIRSVLPGLLPGREIYVCWLDGLVDGTSVTEDVLRPVTERGRTPFPRSAERIMELMERGAVYSYSVKRREGLSDVSDDLVNGCCAVVFDGPGAALTFEVRSKTGRSVSEPTVEKSIKGAKDAFVETLRINTSLVRRKLRNPALKLTELTVGRQSATNVAVMYVKDIAKDETVEELLRRLRAIDADGLLSAAEIEESLADNPKTPFPELLHTERSDAFAMQLLNGRVGVLVDGLPIGFLAPGCLAAFMRVPEDSASHFAVSSMLLALRWAALAISLLLPGAFVAVTMYHQEMLPTKLLLSMSAAKQYVPLSAAAEAIAMLLSFELLQEAGLRLPDPVGQTASIIGALIVGQSAVEAAGYSYPVTASLERCWFPTKEYDGFALPAGEYTALRIVIGAGEGQNWWCVAFPPLCLGAASDTVEDAAAAGYFSQDQAALITEEDQGYVLKFKSMELLGQLQGFLFS